MQFKTATAFSKVALLAFTVVTFVAVICGCGQTSTNSSPDGSSTSAASGSELPRFPPARTARSGESPGPAMIAMPRLIGMTSTQALRKLKAVGWTGGDQNFHPQGRSTTDDVKAGIVLSQQPPENTIVSQQIPVIVEVAIRP